MIGVYIAGEVKSPGFIQIPEGKNLEYALNKVGGVTSDADINSVDIKRILKNGEKIMVAKKQETVEYEENSSSKVNINKATKEELESLEGIGEKTAERIIEYRKRNPFKSEEELLNVIGIGEGKYEKIKDNITV